jgi:hypothetical protein
MKPDYVLDNDSIVTAANRLDERLKRAVPGFDAKCNLNYLIETAIKVFGQDDPDLKIIREQVMKKAGEAAPLDSLPIYTIYERPSDYPHHFVLRLFYATRGGKVVKGKLVGIAETLENARKMLPLGLANVGRDLSDEPQIVETWM